MVLHSTDAKPHVIQIRRMTLADVGLGMRLKTQVGWNQSASDWQRFLRMQPDGCFVAEVDGQAVGTTVTCVFGSIAWLAMVLVEESLRGRGIGKTLVGHALSYLDQQGVTSIRLDATALGRSLYERMGFAPQYSLVRYGGTLQPALTCQWETKARSARQDDLGAIVELDCAVTHTPRAKFLSQLLADFPGSARIIEQHGTVRGYATARPGSTALQIGPCIASAEAGQYLLSDICHSHAGAIVYWDAPESHASAAALAADFGLQPQRTLLRMCRGTAVNDDCERLWASSGPELG